MELQFNIKKMIEQKQFKKALSYFKEHKKDYTKEEVGSNVYLTANILQCLRMTKEWGAGESYLNIYEIKIDYDTSDRIITALSLLRYDWYKNLVAEERSVEKVLHGLIYILPLLGKIGSQFSINLYNTIVSRILKTETKRSQVNWNLIKNFCESVDSHLLNTEPFIINIERKGEMRSSELPSLLEVWYSQYSKSLYITENYDKCIAVSEEAIEKINRMHFSNEIWFARRIAQSFKALGNIELAIEKFEKLLLIKHDWFLLAEMSYLYQERGENEKALNMMQMAMSRPGEISYKVQLVEQLGNIYFNLNKSELAHDHWKLAVCIRKSENWTVSNELAEKVRIESSHKEFKVLKTLLIKKLRSVWKNSNPQSLHKSTNRLNGTVIKVFKLKDAGNDIRIKSDAGTEYYSFIKKTDEIYMNLKEGLSVSFFVRKIDDRPLDKAVKIKEIRR